MKVKAKKRGFGLEMKTFVGKSRRSYLVFRTKQGAFHVFQEVEAKQAAGDCGAKPAGNVRQRWNRLWRKEQ